LFKKLIFAKNLAEHGTECRVLAKADMVNALAYDQEPKAVHHEPDEITKVRLRLVVALLVLENVWSGT
jgi:hypothetical protein